MSPRGGAKVTLTEPGTVVPGEATNNPDAMKKTSVITWKSAWMLGGICAGSLLAGAAPLQRAEVEANPAWVVHIDCDALRPTTIGKYILSVMDQPEAKAKLASFQAVVEMDPRTQLHGATLYGSGPAAEAAVLILYADFDPEHLESLAKAAKDSRSSAHGDVKIYSWQDENKPVTNGLQPRVYAAIQGKRVLFAQQEESIARALDVLSGRTPNLASVAVFPELGKPRAARFVEAAARKLALPNSANPGAAILKMAQSVQLGLGETQQQFTAALTLVADNAEVSGQVLSIAQGLLALVKLQADKPEAGKLANAINLVQTGDQVEAKLRLPAADVVDFMKADAARKSAAAAKDSKN